MGPHQTEKLLPSKGNNQQSKRQPTEWEKTFAKHKSANGLLSKKGKELVQLDSKKSNSHWKMGKGLH